MIRNRWTFSVLIWGILFLLYALTAPRSISEIFSDSLEFQIVAPTLGIAHPTGYPLYTLLGGLWSRILFPFGNWAWRMNLLSALAGATALTLLARLAQRLSPLQNREFPIPWAALIFAFVPVWWQQATIAEVYALHLCFVGAILLVAMGKKGEREKGGRGEGEPVLSEGRQGDRVTGWQGDRETSVLSEAEGRRPGSGTLTVETNLRATHYARRTTLFLLVGLSLAHHRTAVLMFPGLLLYFMLTQPTIFRPQRAWLVWAGALLLPLLLYSYLPIRAAQGVRDLHGDYVNSPSGFARHVLALGYTNFLDSDLPGNPLGNPFGQTGSWLDWLALFQKQLGASALLVAVVGLAVVLFGKTSRKLRADWLLIALVLVTNLIFAVNYRVADVEVFLLPVFFCSALFCEAGINALLALLGKQVLLRGVASVALLVLIFARADWQGAWQRANDWSIHNYAVAMAKTPFPSNSRLIGLEGEMSALRYMQQSELLGVNAQPVVADTDDIRRAAIAESLAGNHPTYITRELSGIEDRYDFSGEGVLVRVWQRGALNLAPLPQVVAVDLAESGLRLLGYDLRKLEQADGAAWQLTLDWQAQRPIEKTFKFSLRWLDSAGKTLLLPDGSQGQDEFPLYQVSPTDHWQIGTVMRDVQIVRLPNTIAPAARTLQVIVYDAADGSEAGRWQVDLPN